MKRIKKLLQSNSPEDIEIGLLLLERKKFYLRFLYCLEWILSFPLFLIFFAPFISGCIRGAKFPSIIELNLYYKRKDLSYIGAAIFWNKNFTERAFDVALSPIGFLYLFLFKEKNDAHI